MRSPEETSQGFTHKFATKRGNFTFPAQRLILGKTLESVLIPNNELWYLEDNAYTDRGQKLPLIVHFTAPILNPGQRGNITFEFKNLTHKDLKVNIGKVFAKAFVLKTKGNSQYNGRFQGQTWESLPFPDLRKEDLELRALWKQQANRNS